HRVPHRGRPLQPALRTAWRAAARILGADLDARGGRARTARAGLAGRLVRLRLRAELARARPVVQVRHPAEHTAAVRDTLRRLQPPAGLVGEALRTAPGTRELAAVRGRGRLGGRVPAP